MIPMLGSPTTTASALSSRSGTFDLSSTRSGSFDVAPQARGGDVLPTQCYICQSKFSATVHSVLQLCDCRVAVCQQCAINRMILNDEFTLDCLICGFKVDSSHNTGIIRNAMKVKELVDKYIERASRFYRIPVPSVIDPTVSQCYPLLSRFGKNEALAPHVTEFLKGSNNSSEGGENGSTTQRRKLNVSYLKLQLARVEHLRAGPLKEMEELDIDSIGNITIEEKDGSLPLGPLKLLYLAKNVYLERLLALGGSDCCGAGNGREIDANCVTCHTTIQPGESIQFSCNCEVLTCRGCAIKGFVSSKHTYRKGIACPSCHKNSMISFSNIEKAKEEEESIIAMMVRQYSTGGVTYSSKSILDLRKLLERLYAGGAAPNTPAAMKTKEAIHELSFHQIQLELARIYVSLERKKSRHEKIIKKEKKSSTKKASKEDDGKEAEFSEADMKGKKAGGAGGGVKGNNKKKGDKDGDIEVDQVLSYDNKADEVYFYEESDRDRGYDLPIGPLRLLRFRSNPYVELYLANTNTGGYEDSDEDGHHVPLDPREREIADLVKAHRFNPFKPKFHTVCPKCTINPQNLECVRMHLKTDHQISRKDEIEKFMKLVTLQPVGYEPFAALPFPPLRNLGGETTAPPGIPLSHDLSIKLLTTNLVY